MILWGSLVNALVIVLGALLGTKIRFPERIRQTIMHALSLAVIVIGISMGLKSDNILMPIGALVLGGIIGEILKIEDKIAKLGLSLQKFGKRKDGNVGSSHFAQAFLTATLIYCVGAMAVIGGLNSGLHGDHQVLYTKSMLDGISAVFYASSLGIGVAFSAGPVFLYQGSIALLATFIAPALSPPVLQELTATGGILILGIGLNLLGLTKIAVGNLLPSMLVVLLLTMFFL